MKEPIQSQKTKIAVKETIHVINFCDADYPGMLREIYKPPKKLYCIGKIEFLNRDSVAVVGARKATGYGRWVAYRVGEKLAEYGLVTVSGLAYGCDAQAHKGALSQGGGTIAVLGCGPDVIYPRGNRELRNQILTGEGLIVSEYPPGTTARREFFPQRNRLIIGLAKALVVSEAGLSSGSLITAEHALQQGKNIFVAPGNMNIINSIGGNKLIQDGAIPLVTMNDIIEGIGLEIKEDRRTTNALGKDESAIYNVIKQNGETNVDLICQSLNKTPSEVNAIITVLEIKGLVSTYLGKISVAN